MGKWLKWIFLIIIVLAVYFVVTKKDYIKSFFPASRYQQTPADSSK